MIGHIFVFHHQMSGWIDMYDCSQVLHVSPLGIHLANFIDSVQRLIEVQLRKIDHQRWRHSSILKAGDAE